MRAAVPARRRPIHAAPNRLVDLKAANERLTVMQRLLSHCAPISPAGGALALLAGCGHKETRPSAVPGPCSYRGSRPGCSEQDLPFTEEVVGTVRAKLHATLEAKLSGRIDKMPVVLGQRSRPANWSRASTPPKSRPGWTRPRPACEQAERDWKRVSALFDQQAVTRAEYRRRRIALPRGQGAAAEAQAMMGYVEILAPFDGVVTKKWADVGDLAVARQAAD